MECVYASETVSRNGTNPVAAQPPHRAASVEGGAKVKPRRQTAPALQQVQQGGACTSGAPFSNGTPQTKRSPQLMARALEPSAATQVRRRPSKVGTGVGSFLSVPETQPCCYSPSSADHRRRPLRRPTTRLTRIWSSAPPTRCGVHEVERLRAAACSSISTKAEARPSRLSGRCIRSSPRALRKVHQQKPPRPEQMVTQAHVRPTRRRRLHKGLWARSSRAGELVGCQRVSSV